MKTTFQIAILSLILSQFGRSEEAASFGNEIIADIKSGHVDHVEVFLTPEDRTYIGALNEELLERWGTATTIKDFSHHKATPLLLRTLTTLRLNPKAENLDLRYGCKFYDSKGRGIHTLYIDSFLERGKYDGKLVIISKTIKDWIEAIRKESHD